MQRTGGKTRQVVERATPVQQGRHRGCKGSDMVNKGLSCQEDHVKGQ